MKFKLFFFFFIWNLFWICKAKKHHDEKISGKETSTPNIIIFLADDMGYGDLSFSGHPTSSTPAIDDLASNGRFFTHFYVTSPVCSPSRASLLTGRYQVRSGTYPGVYFPDNYLGLPENETTIAKLLKEKGYRTQIVGKWHLGVGVDREFLPTNLAYGFDNYYGIPYSHDMCPCEICFPNNGSCYNNCLVGIRYVSCPLFSNKELIEQPVYLPTITERLVEKATEFITEASSSGSPFFLYFPFQHVHFPQFASSEFSTLSPRGIFGDSLMELDSAVGTVMNLLKQMNILNDTLIWFLSDNGPDLKQHDRGGSAGLLRCGKGTTWEGGVRVPSMVYWKNKVTPGRSYALTSSMDILATIASIVDLNTSNLILDGVDISDLLFQENGQTSREFLAVYPQEPDIETGPYAIIYNQYKAHFYTKGSGLSDNTNIDTVCRGTELLTKHDPPLLFDLYKDPGEKYNLDGTDEYNDIIPLMTEWREQHMQNMTWMEPRTRSYNERSQSCCVDSTCEPFPKCCVCPNQNRYNFIHTEFNKFEY